MKFFSLLPLATLFLGAVASPTSSVALEQHDTLEQREALSPLATLQQFTADSKQYTDAIRLSLYSFNLCLSRALSSDPFPCFRSLLTTSYSVTNNSQIPLSLPSLLLATLLPSLMPLLPLLLHSRVLRDSSPTSSRSYLETRRLRGLSI